MALFRIAVAAGLLVAIAPEQTLQVARAAFGLAEETRSLHGPVADAAIGYCRANPAVCAEAVKQATEGPQRHQARSPKP